MQSLKPVLKPLLGLCGLLVLLTLACGVEFPGAEPTPTTTPRPSATPDGNIIYFDAPYAYTLTPASRIPNTRVYYEGEQNDVFVFTIDGQAAYKKLNDTISWRGVIAPSVTGDYQLTIRSRTGNDLFTDGTVHLSVMNPTPLEIPLSSLPSRPPDFRNIQIEYLVPQGRRVPGTTLVYDGQQDGKAFLSGGTTQLVYPLGNSVIWTGRLRDNVLLRYDLVVSGLDDNGLGLSGTAQIWLLP